MTFAIKSIFNCCTWQVMKGRGSSGAARGTSSSARGIYKKKKIVRGKPAGRPPKAAAQIPLQAESNLTGNQCSTSQHGHEVENGGSFPQSTGADVNYNNTSDGVVTSGTGLLVHRPVVPRKKETVKIDHLSEELQQGYRIVADLMADNHRNSNAVYMEALDLDPVRNKEYLTVVQKPMWLRKIKDKLLSTEYTNITELVGDIRLMLENAYRFYGPLHSFTKKGLRLEHILEQKLALLPKEMREVCSLEVTSGKPVEEIKETHRAKTAKITVNGDNFFSRLLHRVKGCRAARDKDLKRRRMEAVKQAKLDKELEVVRWDDELLTNPLCSHMHAMWELPSVGHFIFLTLSCLNIPEIAQYELERILLLPECSSTLSVLMTSLLSSPQMRQRLGGAELPPMPYPVWARKLAQRSSQWYKCYHREGQDPYKVFELLGIEPHFWRICGPRNPFDDKLFHELTLHQRVWLLKSLCDYLLVSDIAGLAQLQSNVYSM